jgi:hypothetical protein
METLSTQFDAAVRSVTVSGLKQAAAIAAHLEVQAVLQADAELVSWGLNTILIGSYARQTARYPGKDVDIFLRLAKLTTAADPAQVYAAVERVLVAKYGLKENGGRVTLQARSLNVEFGQPADRSHDGFSIDAVPAVPLGANWGIPNRSTDLWSVAGEKWVETNPVEFADRTNQLAVSQRSPVVAGDNAYRPIVRLLRQIRHIHLGEDRPGGLYVEVCAYYAWMAGSVAGESWAELLAGTLRQVAIRFRDATANGLVDPVLGTRMKPELETHQWVAAALIFDQLADLADQALNSERCMSAKIWRDILGDNDRGAVLALPLGCDAGGFPIASISPILSSGSDEPRGFALRES